MSKLNLLELPENILQDIEDRGLPLKALAFYSIQLALRWMDKDRKGMQEILTYSPCLKAGDSLQLEQLGR